MFQNPVGVTGLIIAYQSGVVLSDSGNVGMDEVTDLCGRHKLRNL